MSYGHLSRRKESWKTKVGEMTWRRLAIPLSCSILEIKKIFHK
jgi:hypothetical protein